MDEVEQFSSCACSVPSMSLTCSEIDVTGAMALASPALQCQYSTSCSCLATAMCFDYHVALWLDCSFSIEMPGDMCWLLLL